MARRTASNTTAGSDSSSFDWEAEEARLAVAAERLALEAMRLLGSGRAEHAEYLLADGTCLRQEW